MRVSSRVRLTIVITIAAVCGSLVLLQTYVHGVGKGPSKAVLAANIGDVPDLGTCTNQVLSPGSSGPCVKSLQQSLAALGLQLAQDGGYGMQTRLAVLYFQAWDGLAQDGIAGPVTIGALNFAANAPVPAGRGPLPVMPDSDATYSPDGNGLSTCAGASCSYYLGRSATQNLNNKLNSAGTNLTTGEISTVFCGGVGKVWSAGGGPVVGKVAGAACGELALANAYAIQQAVQTAVSEGGCFELKIHNYGSLGGTVPEYTENNGHNCIP